MIIPTTIMFTKAGCNDSSYEKAACRGGAQRKRSCTSRIRSLRGECPDDTDRNGEQSIPHRVHRPICRCRKPQYYGRTCACRGE